MAKKCYTIENLCCANCAAKAEAAMNQLPQIAQAVIVFPTRQLQVTAEDPEALLPQLQEILSSIEPDAVICQEKPLGHSPGCGHCHHHEHHHDLQHGHHHEADERPLPLILGGVLFILGLVLSHVWLGNIPLALPVCLAAWLILCPPVVQAAWKSLLRGHALDENFLMSIASLGAFAIGEAPEAAAVLLFYRVGEYFEHRAVEKSRKQILDAADLRPETVLRLNGDITETIPAGEAQVGNVLLVRPGDRIPLDGKILKGQSSLDTSAVTGESIPRSVGPGDEIFSGCINTTGQLTLLVQKPLEASMVTRILQAVENAAAGKPKIDRFITRFARVYTPIVVAAAIATALIPSLLTGNWQYWVYTALSFLVMSCPCALVLSVPLAFFSGIGLGSRKGILFKGGAAIEALSKVKNVALDKTGTLTAGDFRVSKIVGREDILALCGACEQNSTHPIARSIRQAAAEAGILPAQPEHVEELPGHGIVAALGGKTILCGNEKLFSRFQVTLPVLPQEPGSRILVAENGKYIGYLLISDTVKPGARDAVEQLHRQGLYTVMFTGDLESEARSVAAATGIRQVSAQLLPEEKLQALQALRKQRGSTLFVGDGINDAPVLAGADVGAAMGSGADAALEAADLVFLTSQPGAICQALEIARKTRQIAWQNVVFALAVKALVMALGLMGMASMWLAVLADSGVAALCVLNAIRLLYRK